MVPVFRRKFGVMKNKYWLVVCFVVVVVLALLAGRFSVGLFSGADAASVCPGGAWGQVPHLRICPVSHYQGRHWSHAGSVDRCAFCGVPFCPVCPMCRQVVERECAAVEFPCPAKLRRAHVEPVPPPRRTIDPEAELKAFVREAASWEEPALRHHPEPAPHRRHEAVSRYCPGPEREMRGVHHRPAHSGCRY